MGEGGLGEGQMQREDEVQQRLHLIDLLYQSVLDESIFSTTISQLGGLAGGTHGSLLSWTGRHSDAPVMLTAFSTGSNYCGSFYQDYCRYYHKFDPIKAIWDATQEGAWLVDTKLMTPREHALNSFIHEFMQANGYAGVASLKVQGKDLQHWSFSIQRDIGTRDFSPSGLEQIRIILPHLRQALRLRDHVSELRFSAAIGLGSLDLMTFPIWITNGVGEIQFSNKAADHLLSTTGCALLVSGKILKPTAYASTELFRKILQEATSPLNKKGGAIKIFGLDESSLAVQVLPLPPQLVNSNPWQRPMAMIIAHSRNQSPSLDKVLAMLYAFTPAESRIAMGLLADRSVDEIADQSLVKVSTVRMQIKAMLRKAGCRRQAEMVRLLATLAIVY